MNNPYLGDNLIFIISQPRSGSTLLQRVLGAHPDIQISAETWLMLHPVYAQRDSGIMTEYGAQLAAQGVREFLEFYTDGGNEIHDNAIREWARVLYGAALAKSGKKYFLDKTPRYFFIVPDLYRLFPKATFIFLKRNPLSILSSILSTYVKNKWAAIGFYRPDLLDAPDKILDGISLLGDKAIDLKYEDFVESPEKCCKMLCEFIGIPFVDTMINYGDTPVPKGYMNDPVGIHKHSSPSKVSLDKWKKLAENKQHSYFATRYLESLGEDTLTKLGYPYHDLYRIVRTGPQHKGLYSWELAMRAKNDWTIKDHFISHRYYMAAEKGKLFGTLIAIYRELIRNLRRLKRQII